MSVASEVWLVTRPLRWLVIVAWCLWWGMWLGVSFANEGRIRAECEQGGGPSGHCIREEREDWPSTTTVALVAVLPVAALGSGYLMVRRGNPWRRVSA